MRRKGKRGRKEHGGCPKSSHEKNLNVHLLLLLPRPSALAVSPPSYREVRGRDRRGSPDQGFDEGITKRSDSKPQNLLLRGRIPHNPPSPTNQASPFPVGGLISEISDGDKERGRRGGLGSPDWSELRTEEEEGEREFHGTSRARAKEENEKKSFVFGRKENCGKIFSKEEGVPRQSNEIVPQYFRHLGNGMKAAMKVIHVVFTRKKPATHLFLYSSHHFFCSSTCHGFPTFASSSSLTVPCSGEGSF